MHIQNAVKSQIHELAELHVQCFPGFFLTSLGHRFIALLYRGFIEATDGICLVVVEDKRIVGLAAGTTVPAGFFRELFFHRGLLFAFAAVPGLLRHPWFVARKCLGAVCYRGETPSGIAGALLSSLAVTPTSGGRGVGQMLVSAFANEARQRGCKNLYLTTDQADNDRVNRFYEKCGFRLLDRFKRPGNRIMNRWIMMLER